MRAWQRIAANLSSGLLALFLAIMVWVVAVYEQAPPRTDFLPTAIPIQILDRGENLIISNPIPTEVRIRVRALADTWGQLSAQDFEATLDLLGLESGQHDVPVVVTTLLDDISIEDQQPSRITVNLEAIEERQVQVRVRVLDEERVPLGYTARLPEVSPEEITIRGPKTTVDSVTEATIDVSIADARDTVTKQDAPVILDASGRKVRGLSVTPEKVTVAVVVQRLGGYRDVAVRASTEGAPAPGYWVSNINVEPVLVTVFGEQAVIEALPGFVDTETIDVQDATSDVIKRVVLALPSGVIVLGDAATEDILVQISIQPLLGGITLQVTLELTGLRPGLIAQYSPEAVDIILSGPLPALQDLLPEDLRAVLNLNGLGRDTHTVNPIVILPEGLGLEVKSIVPDIVEVTIE